MREIILKGHKNKAPFSSVKKGDIFYLIELDDKGKEIKDGPFEAMSDAYINEKGIRTIDVKID